MRNAMMLLLAVACIWAGQQQPAKTRAISVTELKDKIRGGWAGQMIGVSYGAPTEFRSNGRIITGRIPWSPSWVRNSIQQDDLYVEMTFAEVLDRFGLDATAEQFGEAFAATKYPLWHANAAARRNLAAGIKAPLSGSPKHNIHANDIDFQIEADFIGLMTPGLPGEASRYAHRIGGVMNSGDGIYGGVFVAAMYSAAFFESDARKIVEAGLAAIPAQSQYAQTIADVLRLSRQYPNDWKKTWQALETKWGTVESCPEGALRGFNIEASLNGAYIALGLVYWGGDFTKTLEISTRAGQDSDCNPSNAAGILGVVLGYSKIPGVWKDGIPAIANTKFIYTNYTFEEICESTLKRALAVVERAGGSRSGDVLTVPTAASKGAPVVVALEAWSMGRAVLQADTSYENWQWKGEWSDTPSWDRESGDVRSSRTATGAGHEAAVRFTGTGFSLEGSYFDGKGNPLGGVADIFVDGKPVGEIRATAPRDTFESSLFHTYGLPVGEHTVRIVTKPGLPGTPGTLTIRSLAAYMRR
jgi:ADP-ribosylglycohydrolase